MTTITLQEYGHITNDIRKLHTECTTVKPETLDISATRVHYARERSAHDFELDLRPMCTRHLRLKCTGHSDQEVPENSLCTMKFNTCIAHNTSYMYHCKQFGHSSCVECNRIHFSMRKFYMRKGTFVLIKTTYLLTPIHLVCKT